MTKQTARLNWKDFRLRATLYVNVEKKGQRDSARGLWAITMKCYDLTQCAFFGVSKGRHVKSIEETRARNQSAVGVRVSLSSHQREGISEHPFHAAAHERTAGWEWGDDPRPPVGFVAE